MKNDVRRRFEELVLGKITNHLIELKRPYQNMQNIIVMMDRVKHSEYATDEYKKTYSESQKIRNELMPKQLPKV